MAYIGCSAPEVLGLISNTESLKNIIMLSLYKPNSSIYPRYKCKICKSKYGRIWIDIILRPIKFYGFRLFIFLKRKDL